MNQTELLIHTVNNGLQVILGRLENALNMGTVNNIKCEVALAVQACDKMKRGVAKICEQDERSGL
jgi:hypothetical protein